MKCCKDAELAADTMHANDVPFLTTMSENIHHGEIYTANNLKRHSLYISLKIFIRSCAIIGLLIVILAVDIKFKLLKDSSLLDVATFFLRKNM